MTRTTHGHHIPGTSRNDEMIKMDPYECGGLFTCNGCREEAFGNPQYSPKAMTPATDDVNHPAHYTDGNIEVADFIADKNFNFFLGNVIKYLSRAGKKDPAKHIQDLKKAQWYLTREIQRLENDGA